MITPKISIITPSLNQGEFIEGTILSVLGQNYPNLEYIIIDGGSTDNSVGIINKYCDRLKYWISEEDYGQASAINKGFEIATGEILMWINSDDILMPHILHEIAKLYHQNGDKIYIGNCIHFKEEINGTLQTWGSNIVESNKNLKLEIIDYIIQPSSFWTRQVWEKAGKLNEDMVYIFDWEWFIRCKTAGVEIISTSKCLSMYRYHDTHKTSTGGSTRQKEIISLYKSYSPVHSELYSLLIMDANKKPSLFYKILRKLLSRFGISGYGQTLKYLAPKKYHRFSTSEIEHVQKML